MQNDDFLYVNLNDFDIDKVIVLKTHKNENDKDHSNGVKRTTYVILYRYDLDNTTQHDKNINNNSYYTAALRIYCPDMIVSNYKKAIPNYKYAIFPFNYKSQSWEKVRNIIQLIKVKVYDTIISDISDNSQTNSEKIHIYMPINSDDKKLGCNVKKLEGITKNNINQKITHIDKLNDLLTNYVYNNKKTGSYFLSNNIIQFKASITTNILRDMDQDDIQENNIQQNNIHQDKISFMPVLCAMELYYNKIKYVPSINTENKIVTSDRLLVL